MIGLVVMMLAAGPDLESLGSVDGPFVWVDARASVDSTFHEADVGSGQVVSGGLGGGFTVLSQGQLFAGWGMRVRDRRLSLAAAFTATGVLTDAWLQDEPTAPRFEPAPTLLSAALTLPVNGVVLVPMLAATLPTRRPSNIDPILALQPQLRFRTGLDGLVVGAAVFVNLPLVTRWTPEAGDVHWRRRCLPEESRCRTPVTRELWRAGLSLQSEYELLPGFSGGVRASLELGDEQLPFDLVLPPGWSTVDLRGLLFANWSLGEHFGVTATGGAGWQHFSIGVVAQSWEASLSVWFRTDGRLNRMWLDR